MGYFFCPGLVCEKKKKRAKQLWENKYLQHLLFLWIIQRPPANTALAHGMANRDNQAQCRKAVHIWISCISLALGSMLSISLYFAWSCYVCAGFLPVLPVIALQLEVRMSGLMETLGSNLMHCSASTFFLWRQISRYYKWIILHICTPEQLESFSLCCHENSLCIMQNLIISDERSRTH